MGKLLLLIFAIVLVLVILPGDIREWCMIQINNLTADSVDFMDETNIPSMTNLNDFNQEIIQTQLS